MSDHDELREARQRAYKLQKFKDWVHAYLDSKGIPHHPPGTHGAEGCRIGDRMDYVFARVVDNCAALRGLTAACEQNKTDLEALNREAVISVRTVFRYTEPMIGRLAAALAAARPAGGHTEEKT